MNDKPIPGSTEEMRGWINLVSKADKDGATWTQIVFPRSILGTVALIASIITLLAVMAQGVEAGRSFLCNTHLISNSCSINSNSK
jgi:hypothetical protein